jgi:hypothetical protein
MTNSRTIEQSISSWLQDEAVSHIPDRVLETTFGQTREMRQVGSSPWRFPMFRSFTLLAAAGAAAVVIAVAGYALIKGLPTTPIGGDPRAAFLGVWVSTSDADGGKQTMTVAYSGAKDVDVVVTDTIASQCAGASSTMTATGSVDGNQLVLDTPNYQCDNGSTPAASNGALTLTRDPQTDTLSDGAADIWRRASASTRSTSPTTQPSDLHSPAPVPPTAGLPTSGGLWPQLSLDEVGSAQQSADAGEPDHQWQIDSALTGEVSRSWMHLVESRPAIVERFMHEVLGWDHYMVNVYPGRADADGAADGTYRDISYVRCGRPIGGTGFGVLCFPTLDGQRYETVSLDLAQPARQGSDGLWVVSKWGLTEPYAPLPVVTAIVDRFFQARIDGHGAENFVNLDPATPNIPLLYATSSGSPYERYEIYNDTDHETGSGLATSVDFSVRLFADGGKTVVEAPIRWDYWSPDRVSISAAGTTENGRPVSVRYPFLDGRVDVSASSPWVSDCGGECLGWNSGAGAGYIYLSDGPFGVKNGCLADAGDPTPLTIGSLTATVTNGSGGIECPLFENWWTGSRQMRVYQIEAPAGSSTPNLTIAVAADNSQIFGDVMQAAEPVINSVEFQAR